MNALRLEQEEAANKAEELQTKVKSLEQENLAKEQEITSLSHRNQLLETEVEKLETGIKEAKSQIEESGQHGTQNEALQRRLQLLEEEAEESDKNIRETNEKYGVHYYAVKYSRFVMCRLTSRLLDYVKQMSKPVTSSVRSRLSRVLVTNGRRSTRRCLKSTQTSSRNCRTSRTRSETSEQIRSGVHERAFRALKRYHNSDAEGRGGELLGLFT